MENQTKRKKIVLRLEPEIYRALCNAAKEEGIPKSKFLNKILKSSKTVTTENYYSVYKKAINFQFYVDYELYKDIFKASCEKHLTVSQIIRSQIQPDNISQNNYRCQGLSSLIKQYWDNDKLDSVIESYERFGASSFYEKFLTAYSFHNKDMSSDAKSVFDSSNPKDEKEEKIYFLFKLLFNYLSNHFQNSGSLDTIDTISKHEPFIIQANNKTLSGLFYYTLAGLYDDLELNDLAIQCLKKSYNYFSEINERNFVANIHAKIAKLSARTIDKQLFIFHFKKLLSLFKDPNNSGLNNHLIYLSNLFEYAFQDKLRAYVDITFPSRFINIQNKLGLYKYEVIRLANLVHNGVVIPSYEFDRLKPFVQSFKNGFTLEFIELFETIYNSKNNLKNAQNYFENILIKNKFNKTEKISLRYFQQAVNYIYGSDSEKSNAQTNLLELSYTTKSPIVAKAAQYTLNTRQFGAVR